jgi:uncharacterized protein (DUF3084 family)
MRAREFDANQAMQQQEFALNAQNTEREAGLKEREFGHKQQLETGKLGLEQAKFQHQGSMDQAKMQQDQSVAVEAKQTLDAMAALQAQIQEMMQAVSQFMEAARKPARLMRGPDGRATHVENGHGVYAVERGPDGRAMGLMQ